MCLICEALTGILILLMGFVMVAVELCTGSTAHASLRCNICGSNEAGYAVVFDMQRAHHPTFTKGKKTEQTKTDEKLLISNEDHFYTRPRPHTY